MTENRSCKSGTVTIFYFRRLGVEPLRLLKAVGAEDDQDISIRSGFTFRHRVNH